MTPRRSPLLAIRLARVTYDPCTPSWVRRIRGRDRHGFIVLTPQRLVLIDWLGRAQRRRASTSQS